MQTHDITNLVAVGLVYAGLILIAVGLVTAVRPVRRLGIGSRSRAVQILGAGVLCFAIGALIPAPDVHAASDKAGMSLFLPTYQFHEVHETRIHASPAEVFRALKEVTAAEIRLFRTLTWIRSPRLRKPEHETVITPAPDKPILDVALNSTFLLLYEVPDREIVIGTIVINEAKLSVTTPQEYAEVHQQHGIAKAAMDFRITAQEEGWSRLTTETRVYATDRKTKKKFARYWRVIYPGSALIRRSWLAAVRKRAENSAAQR